MWNCPTCARTFHSPNQSHTCSSTTVGELFFDKPDELVLAFDRILQLVEDWTPNTYGAAKHSVVFHSKKAWLIVKPMKTQLDIKFYHSEELVSDKLHKVALFFGKFAHHIRVSSDSEIEEEVSELIRKGFEFSLE